MKTIRRRKLGDIDWTNLADLPDSATTFTDRSTPDPSTTYEYQVLQDGDPSNTATVQTGPLSTIYWSWNRPLGTLAPEQDNFLWMMVAKLKVGIDQAHAENICDQIMGTAPPDQDSVFMSLSERDAQVPRVKGSQPGELCVMLQHWGVGDWIYDADPGKHNPNRLALWAHELDSVETQQTGDHLTPWMDNGIAEAKAWTQWFCAHWAATYPDVIPSRFHFDTEPPIGPLYDYNQSRDCFGRMMTSDSRWDTLPLRHPAHQGKTIAQLWAEAEAEGITFDPGAGSSGNIEWWPWYQRVLGREMDQADREAGYEVIWATWPSCKCSQYEVSSMFDGEGINQYGYPLQVHHPFGPANPNRYQQWDGRGDTSAPVLYYSRHSRWQGTPYDGTPDPPPDETELDATIRMATSTMDQLVGSYTNANNITPWVFMTGGRFKESDEQDDPGPPVEPGLISRGLAPVPHEYTTGVYSAGRERGIYEYIVWGWSDPQASPEDWDRFTEYLLELDAGGSTEQEDPSALPFLLQPGYQPPAIAPPQTLALRERRTVQLTVPVQTPAGVTDVYRLRVKKTDGTDPVYLEIDASGLTAEGPQ